MRGDEVAPDVEEELLERYGESRTCKGCGEDKAFSAYNVCRWDGNTYLAGECIPCQREKERERSRELRDRSDDEIPIPDQKECTGCGEVKSSDEFYTQRDNRNGLSYRCKGCYDARPSRSTEKRRQYADRLSREEWRKEQRRQRLEGGLEHQTRSGIKHLRKVEERLRERRVGRLCSECGERKARDEFYDNDGTVNGKDVACKRCRREAFRERYRKNIEEERARVRQYKQAHPDVVAKQHGRRNERWKRARDQADGSVTEEAVEAMLEAANRCNWCRRRFRPSETKTIDHVIPLVEGGEHSLANLCVACEVCNLSKGAKMPDEWTPGGQLALSM